MLEIIMAVTLFIVAVWSVITLIIDECNSRKQKTVELEKMKLFNETVATIQHNHQIDKCTKEISVYTINEASGLHSLEPIPPKKEDRLYNCPNCGAPITGDKCEYCGTMFRDRSEDVGIFYADNAPVFTVVRLE